jgi:hypothetical protein
MHTFSLKTKKFKKGTKRPGKDKEEDKPEEKATLHNNLMFNDTEKKGIEEEGNLSIGQDS